MSASPYRPAPPETPPCEHTTRCCGQCHAAVGGCLHGVFFKVGLRKVPAGTSIDRTGGTHPVRYCTVHKVWEPETGERDDA